MTQSKQHRVVVAHRVVVELPAQDPHTHSKQRNVGAGEVANHWLPIMWQARGGSHHRSGLRGAARRPARNRLSEALAFPRLRSNTAHASQVRASCRQERQGSPN
jgi:hypothetical protein